MAEPRDNRASAFRQVPGLAPMLLASMLSRTGATMIGLSMGFVAYEQTASALTVAIVASSFGLAFAASSLVAGHVLARVGLRSMLVGALASQIAGALALASVTSTAGADVTWLTSSASRAGWRPRSSSWGRRCSSPALRRASICSASSRSTRRR